MRYKYDWNPAVPHSALGRIDAEAFAEELERIESKYDAVTSKALVREAKPKDHIAHEFIYHVGQRKAAQLHYEQRAGLLMRSLLIMAPEEAPVSVRARIAVASESGGDRFASAQEMSTDEGLTDLHRKTLLRRMNALRQELIDFDEFVEVVAAITKVLEQAA